MFSQWVSRESLVSISLRCCNLAIWVKKKQQIQVHGFQVDQGTNGSSTAPHFSTPQGRHLFLNLSCDNFKDSHISFRLATLTLQRSYKQKPPPGKIRDVERETGHVLSHPGDFLFLDKFTSTGFINKIYNMEVGISLSESLIPNLQKKKAFLDCLGARRRHLGGDSSKVWNNLDAGDIPPHSRIWNRLA